MEGWEASHSRSGRRRSVREGHLEEDDGEDHYGYDKDEDEDAELDIPI